jgi:hypothetical protein
MSMIAALLKHCGAPGEKLSSFSAEYKKLTDEDKAWFRAEFSKVGVEIITKAAA